jgi:hypothetical protein
MRRGALAAMYLAALAFSRGAAAQDAPDRAAVREPERGGSPAVSIEATGLAYGLFVRSPRACATVCVPLGPRMELQLSPAVAWGGEDGSRLFELALPVAARLYLGSGTLSSYAAAGLELGWGRMPAGESVAAAGLIAEAGARLGLFGSGFFLEPYIGGAVMAASLPDGPAAIPSLFGGIRIGMRCGPWPLGGTSP